MDPAAAVNPALGELGERAGGKVQVITLAASAPVDDHDVNAVGLDYRCTQDQPQL